MMWQTPKSFGPIALFAALIVDPTSSEFKVPSGVKLMPHKHPRIYTVMSGVFYIGLATNLTAIR
jgi:hypothetical protein